MMKSLITTASVTVAMSLVAACAVGPPYVAPQVPVPPAYKEYQPVAGNVLQPAQPSDQVSRQGWWELFGDAQLNDLEARLAQRNPTLAEAEARLREARAVVRQDRAAYFPVVTGTGSA